MYVNLIDILHEEVVVKDPGGEAQTIGELREINEDILLGNAAGDMLRLSLGEVVYGEDGAEWPALLEMSNDKAGHNLLTLHEHIAEPPKISDPARVRDGWDETIRILQQGKREELIAFVEQQIYLRRRDLVMLRRLMYVHHTAVQNAVDTVQSKRVDFSEQKEETWVDGVWGALFFAVLFAIFPPEALITSALMNLTRGVTRVLTGRVLQRIGSGARLSLIERVNALKPQLNVLRSFSAGIPGRVVPASLRPGMVSMTRGDARALAEKLSAEISDLRAQRVTGKDNQKQLKDFLVESAAKIFEEQPLKAVPTVLGEKVKSGIKKEAGKDPIGLLGMLLGKAPSNDKPKVNAGVPLDIAIKEQVQELYASIVFFAEDVISTLESFRDGCRSVVPGDEERAALLALLMTEPPAEPEAGESSTDIFAVDVQQLVLAATDAYEQLIWIFLFGGKVMKKAIVRPSASIAHGEVEPSIQYRPQCKNLLTYLRTRFYPHMDEWDIAWTYMKIDEGIEQRKLPGTDGKSDGVLEWSRFANPTQILNLIKDVNVKSVRIEPAKDESAKEQTNQ